MSDSATLPNAPAPSLSAFGGLERLYDSVQAVVPSVQFPLLQTVVFSVVDEFCTMSTFWRVDLIWKMPPFERQVDFNPIDSNAIAIWCLSVNGLDLGSHLGRVRWRILPVCILEDLGRADKERVGTAQVACKPSSLARTLPTFLVDQWHSVLLDGVLQHLYQQPAKPYSSPQLATYHGARFRFGINRARDAATRLNSDQQSPRNYFPYFARGRRRQ